MKEKEWITDEMMKTGELNLLGSIWYHPEMYEEIRSILEPTDFLWATHRCMYQAFGQSIKDTGTILYPNVFRYCIIEGTREILAYLLRGVDEDWNPVTQAKTLKQAVEIRLRNKNE